MSKLSEKTTIYLNPTVKKFLQMKAVQQSTSVSDILNERGAELLEDYEDSLEIEKRRDEPTITWEQIKHELDTKHGI